jgi:putative transposase
MLGNPCRWNTELGQRHRCADWPVHPARYPVVHTFRQWPEFVDHAVQNWVKAVGAKTACIETGSSWENGYWESFNARFRDAFLNGEIFYSLREAQILIEEWRKPYNTKRPHSALGSRPPVPETIVQMNQWPTMH